MLTAFAVVREREIGTLEQVIVTPIRRWEFILGKTLPFFLIGFADCALVAIVGAFVFASPSRQPLGFEPGTRAFPALRVWRSLVHLHRFRTQGQALISAFFFNDPAIIFSGFAFPMTSIPPVLQWITYLDPLRYFEVVLRSVFLKGVGLSVLWPQMVGMAIFAPILFPIGFLRLRKFDGLDYLANKSPSGLNRSGAVSLRAAAV